jgi:ADP-heptose:LPS heptosyltransferase
VKRLRLAVGLLLARFHFRKQDEKVIRFTDSISRSRRALVILPETPADVSAVQWALRYLGDRFSGGKVVVVARSELAPWLQNDRRYDVITYQKDDISFWYVPRRELRRKLKKGTFDVALDLNLSFVLPSAYLCRESQAPLRVGFSKTHADRFYNFQIQTRATTSLNLAYRSFVRCLDMF